MYWIPASERQEVLNKALEAEGNSKQDRVAVSLFAS